MRRLIPTKEDIGTEKEETGIDRQIFPIYNKQNESEYISKFLMK